MRARLGKYFVSRKLDRFHLEKLGFALIIHRWFNQPIWFRASGSDKCSVDSCTVLCKTIIVRVMFAYSST